MIKAVLFDVANVIIPWNPDNLYKKIILDERVRDYFYSKVATLDWHKGHDLGVSFKDNREFLIAKHPKFKVEIEAWGNRFDEMFESPLDQICNIIEELSRNRMPIYALTNMPLETGEKLFNKYDVFKKFVSITSSGVEKVAKPDPEIYYRALKKMNKEAREVLFIDDALVNIEAASEIGFDAYLFESPEKLRHYLKSLDILR